MPRGGARTGSGPAPTPGSARSDARGLTFNQLPAEGYDGEIPDFVGPPPSAREQLWWEWAWRTPQAALWATAQWSWVVPAVADWCRLKVQAEGAEVPGTVWTTLRQRESDILLNNEALVKAGYVVATDELAAKRTEAAESDDYDPRAEMQAINGDG